MFKYIFDFFSVLKCQMKTTERSHLNEIFLTWFLNRSTHFVKIFVYDIEKLAGYACNYFWIARYAIKQFQFDRCLFTIVVNFRLQKRTTGIENEQWKWMEKRLVNSVQIVLNWLRSIYEHIK